MHPGESYLRWYFDSRSWKTLHYRGIRTLKFPNDVWNYQEIFFDHNIEWVIETGSRHGGSAVLFADLLQNLGRKGKRVFSIDLYPQYDPRALEDTRIEFLQMSSASRDTAALVMSKLPAQRKPLFLILDSDHAAKHVVAELEAWIPHLQSGDYLIVEDTIVNGNPVYPEFGPGPLEAIREYIEKHPGVLRRDEAREHKFGATFAVEGYYIKA